MPPVASWPINLCKIQLSRGCFHPACKYAHVRGPLLYFCLMFLIGWSNLVYAQEFDLAGIVLDSASKQPIPFVAIGARGRKSSTISDENGRFNYRCFFGDTVIFTRLGYQRQSIIALPAGRVRIRMREIPELLESVTIYGSYTPQGAERWQKAVPPIRLMNPAGQISNTYMQTFGVGVSFGVQFDYFSKEKREKRKLMQVQKEFEKTRVFRLVMEDPKTKQYLMRSFQISEEEYEARLVAFNQQMPDARYVDNRDDILNLLVGFFAQKR